MIAPQNTVNIETRRVGSLTDVISSHAGVLAAIFDLCIANIQMSRRLSDGRNHLILRHSTGKKSIQ